MRPSSRGVPSPGIKKKDINIEVEGRRVVIQRRAEPEKERTAGCAADLPGALSL